MQRLTVLVCTHNRAGLLAKTLDSLNAAERPAGCAVDILVAANACSDDTHADLDVYRQHAAAAGQLPLEWFAEPIPGKSHALNSALPRVQSDLVAFVDDDHRVDARYLVAVCQAALAWPAFDLFCGRILPDWDGSEPRLGARQRCLSHLPVAGAALRSRRQRRRTDARPGHSRRRQPVPAHVLAGAHRQLRHRHGPHRSRPRRRRGSRLGAARAAPRCAPALCAGDGCSTTTSIPPRLGLGYLMKKAYKRTASTVQIDPARNGATVPKYLYRKLAEYGLKACTAFGQARRRFYLVRTAAALGEIAGHLQPRTDTAPSVPKAHDA